jgi:hypothetical protein
MTSLRRLGRFLFRDHETCWWFACIGTLLYVSFLIWSQAYHELWRDEVHPWILARLADGFWDIVTGDRVYDGHPPLWYWYLRVWGWLTDRAWGLRAANIFVMGCAALLFLRFAPFPRPLKLLLLASYQLGYEYGVLARNYSLGWLLAVAFCCAYQPLRPRFTWLTVLLALLTITSVFGAFLACALFLTLVPLALAIDPHHDSPAFVSFHLRKAFLVSAAGLGLALTFALLSTLPPDPNPFAPGWDFSGLNLNGLKIALKRSVHALLPVRAFGDVSYWTNQAYFWDRYETPLYAVAAGMIAWISLALAPRWSLVAAFAVGLGLISLFPLIRYGSGMRHIGNLLILVIALMWIARLWKPKTRYLSLALLLVIGAFQHQSFLVAASMEKKYVFSDGWEMAEWIERAGLKDMTIVAGPEALAMTVTGHLNRSFISSETEEINQTKVFHGRRRGYSEKRLIERAAAEVRAKHRAVLVLSSRPLQPTGPKFSLLYATKHPDIEEAYWLYRMEE